MVKHVLPMVYACVKRDSEWFARQISVRVRLVTIGITYNVVFYLTFEKFFGPIFHHQTLKLSTTSNYWRKLHYIVVKSMLNSSRTYMYK